MTVRAVTAGLFDAKIDDVPSEHVLYYYEDEEAERAANLMAKHRVRGLPVMNRDKLLVGIVSLGDLGTGDEESAGVAFSDVSEPNEAPRR